MNNTKANAIQAFAKYCRDIGRSCDAMAFETGWDARDEELRELRRVMRDNLDDAVKFETIQLRQALSRIANWSHPNPEAYEELWSMTVAREALKDPVR